MSTLLHLTRTQLRFLVDLRRDGYADTDGRRRQTYGVLVDAELAYESDAGCVRITQKGRDATVVHGVGVLLGPTSARRGSPARTRRPSQTGSTE